MLFPFLGSASGQTFKVLHSFVSGKGDLAFPSGGLALDPNGDLYGAAINGGENATGGIFEITKAGKESIFVSFPTRADGGWGPSGNLLRDTAGNFYAASPQGGDPNCTAFGSGGCGAVFKIDTTGTEEFLYKFEDGSDGGYPLSGVIEDSSGNLYGTTESGGETKCGTSGTCGVIFELKEADNWSESVLHTFADTDGSTPESPLVRDSAGNLYGTTAVSTKSCGEVFKLTAKGVLHILHSFSCSDGADGSRPGSSPLILDAHGNIYGTTGAGGDKGCGSLGCGVIFKLSPAGKETILYAFTGGADGSGPNGLLLDSAGNLYGSAFAGGNLKCGLEKGTGCGTLFELAADGTFSVLHTFAGTSDGSGPTGSLLEDSKGNLYGVTTTGGKSDYGTAFRFTPATAAISEVDE